MNHGIYKKKNCTEEDTDFSKELKPAGSKVFTTKVDACEVKSLSLQLMSLTSIEETEMAIVYLRRCIDAWRDLSKRRKGDPDTSVTKKTSMESRNIHQDRIDAREYLIKLAQSEEMSVIIKQMNKGLTYEEAFLKTPKEKRESWMAELRKYIQFLDENGILRMGGRLQNSKLLFTQKHPAFLPRRHWITRRYITGRHG